MAGMGVVAVLSTRCRRVAKLKMQTDSKMQKMCNYFHLHALF